MPDPPGDVPADTDDRWVALDGFAQASRLVTAARRHYSRGHFRRSAASLTTLATVLVALEDHVQRVWFESAAAAGATSSREPRLTGDTDWSVRRS